MGNFKRAVFFLLVAIVSTGIVFSGTATATLLFSDSFTGTAGNTITTYDSGYVKDAGAGGTAKIDSPGLAVAGKYDAGNSLYLSQVGDGPFSYTHAFANTAVTTLYGSVYLKPNNIPSTTSSNMYGLFVDAPVTKTGGAGNERSARFGIQNHAGTLRIFGAVENASQTINYLAYEAGSTAQLVWKYEWHSLSSDYVTISFALNPDVGSEPGAWTPVGNTDLNGSTGHNGWHMDKVRVETNLDLASGWIDEIRIGTTYDDVVKPAVPIPAAVWLLGSGLIGLLGFRLKIRK